MIVLFPFPPNSNTTTRIIIYHTVCFVLEPCNNSRINTYLSPRKPTSTAPTAIPAKNMDFETNIKLSFSQNKPNYEKKKENWNVKYSRISLGRTLDNSNHSIGRTFPITSLNFHTSSILAINRSWRNWHFFAGHRHFEETNLCR